MKKGKGEEKNTVPLFPRLHLNDTEKGGPRAPPRNKMALYEQLSIPTQRFKKGAVSTNSNNTASMTPPTTSEGSSPQRGAPLSVQRSVSGQSAEQSDNRFSNSKIPRVQPQMEKKTEDDDFRVPMLSQTNVHDDFTRYRSNNNGMKLIHSSHGYTQHSIVHAPTDGDETKRRSIVLPVSTQKSKSHSGENVEEIILNNQKSVEDISNSSSTKITELSACQSDVYACGEPGDNSVKKSRTTLLEADLSLLPPHKAERHSTSRVLRDAMNVCAGSNNGNSSVSKPNYRSEGQRSIVENESREDGTFGSFPVASADVGDHTSDETSMVDCALSPDDVVGIMGQKHFWKARKAIVNQQRVFAVQVFELHRLIKVQKLMAGTPDLLHNSSLLGKSIQSSSPMKLPIPVDCIDQKPADAINPKNGSDKQPNHRMECSAENNVVGKESISEQNGGHQPCSKPTSVNSPMTVIPRDNVMGSWYQNQMKGQQWLIPMMSPSEGLVYKPYYPSPGMMGPFYGGGCGPPGPPPMAGNFVSSGYGAVACQQFPGMTMPPFAFHAGPQGFFPPAYANIPFMNHSITDSGADQTNHMATSGLPVQSPFIEANNANSRYHRHSCKSSSQKDEFDGAIRDSDVQASRGRGRGNSSSGGSNVLPLLTVDTLSCNTRPQHDDVTDRPTRVIKVVPHGGVSATESAARIFQSIQQERKRHRT